MHERPIGDLVDALRGIGARIDYLGSRRLSAAADSSPATIALDRPVRVRGNVSSQFLTGLLMALPLARPRVHARDRGRAHLQAVRRDHAQHAAALRRRRAARTAGRASTSRRARGYRSPGEIFVEGDASSASYFLAAGAISGSPAAGRCASKASGARASRATCASPKCSSAWAARVTMGENWIEARRGARRARGRLRALDADLNHIPDAAMTAAVLALFADGTEHAAQHRELAREGDRPHRRDGDRAAQARRDGGGGRGLPARSRRPRPASRRTRRSTPTTTTAWRCASRSPRSAACRCASTTRTAWRKTFPTISRCSPRSAERRA